MAKRGRPKKEVIEAEKRLKRIINESVSLAEDAIERTAILMCEESPHYLFPARKKEIAKKIIDGIADSIFFTLKAMECHKKIKKLRG